MPISNAEAQRRFRARQKQKKKDALRQPDQFPTPVAATPFHAWLAEHGDWDSGVDLPLALAGIAAPEFTDDRGPEDFVLNGAIEGVDEPFGVASDSLGRAEVMVGCLIDAAAALAEMISSYKQQQIRHRIAQIEGMDLSDPAVRKRALAENVRLHKMLNRLGKKVRWTFPEWKVADP